MAQATIAAAAGLTDRQHVGSTFLDRAGTVRARVARHVLPAAGLGLLAASAFTVGLGLGFAATGAAVLLCPVSDD